MHGFIAVKKMDEQKKPAPKKFRGGFVLNIGMSLFLFSSDKSLLLDSCRFSFSVS